MPFDDMLDDGKAEAGAATVAAARGIDAVKAFGEARQMVARNAGAMVDDGDFHPAALAAHGHFDPVLLGWTSREPILGTATSIVTVNGIFRPFALVDGRGVATWRLDGDRVQLTPFAHIAEAAARALDADAADVVRFLRPP